MPPPRVAVPRVSHSAGAKLGASYCAIAGQQLHPAREACRVTFPPSPKNSSISKVSLGQAIKQARSLKPLCQAQIRLEINV